MSNRIKFNKLSAKNFRSVDNAGLDLTFQTGTTLVGSLENGAGKSTMYVYALFYALFDKNYKKGDNKSALINSRSNKDCVVTVDFDANGHNWVVERGQKPTVFKISKDGVPILDEASLKDYGANLDKVLGMDEKAFCNTILLGKDKFVPFVSMSAPERRNYGEQMIDLVVISHMNDLNKEAIKALNVEILQSQTALNNIDVEIRNINNIIDIKKKHAADVAVGIDDDITKEEAELLAMTNQRKPLESELVGVTNQYNTLKTELEAEEKKLREQEAARNKLIMMNNDAKTKRDSAVEALKTAKQNSEQRLLNDQQAANNRYVASRDALATRLANLKTDCPHCLQSLPADKIQSMRDSMAKELNVLKSEFQDSLVRLSDASIKELEQFFISTQATIDSQSTMFDKTAKLLKDSPSVFELKDPTIKTKLGQMQVISSNLSGSIRSLKDRAAGNEMRIQSLQVKKAASLVDNSWVEETKKIEDAEQRLEAGKVDLADKAKRMKSHEINAVMLKDDGVKAELVDQYLPFINGRINDRLNKMNLFININLNTEFEIEMQSPDRRGQSINSLSTGQQCRIDLAVLLAWRDVAASTSSCDSNLLILDEILENLSQQGVEDFIEMWMQESNEHTCLYAISQRVAELGPQFDRTTIYKLTDDSTRLVDSTD